MMYGFDKDFAPGDDVWFSDLQSRVLRLYGEIPSWGVPIIIGDMGVVTIAHCDALSREKPAKKQKKQKKQKHYETVDLELTPELQEFMLKELCRRDIKPSKWLKEVVENYIEHLGLDLEKGVHHED